MREKYVIKRNIPLFFMSIILLTLLNGCSETIDEPLSIASSPWPGYEPLSLARELGYLSENKYELNDLPSSDITMESFRNGSADIGTLTLDETLELLHDGIPLKIIAVLDVSNGADAVVAKPEIKKLSDLKGKRISIINISLGFYMLNRMLDKAGLKREDVEVFPLAEIKQEKFYENNKADAVISFEPMISRIIKKGAHVIFDSSDIPNEIMDVLVVHEDIYHKRRPDLCNLVQQWNKSLEFIKSNPEKSSIMISRRLGLKVPEYDEMMKGLHIVTKEESKILLGGSSPGIIKVAEKLTKVMVENGLLPNKPNINKAVDSSFVSCI